MIASSRPRLTFEEYCQIEVDSSVRHEWHDGHAWAMAGGSREHAAICANVVAALSVALRGRPCQVHTSDLRIRVRATGLATYPDASVVCGRAKLDPDDRRGHTVTNPTIVVEVLSPSTEQYDRTEKLAQYQRIESLKEIVLVAHAEQRIDVVRHGDDGSWSVTTHTAGAVALESVGVEFDLAEAYRDPLST